MLKYLLILIPGLIFSQYVYVQKVIDGDTFISDGISYRISDIDAPEITQTYGRESQSYLSKLIQNKVVSVVPHTTDKYGRQIVSVNYEGDIAEKMISSGNAWWYERYSNNLKLKRLQERARKSKLGLWNQKYIQPYEYRKKK